ncbi:hypothetical protein HDU76_005403 [Blyttiomyces sp. JEL0837]|nr:hypothetical protein HDU76_005403 [Blyttiomyces sp. JEL0837]
MWIDSTKLNQEQVKVLVLPAVYNAEAARAQYTPPRRQSTSLNKYESTIDLSTPTSPTPPKSPSVKSPASSTSNTPTPTALTPTSPAVLTGLITTPASPLTADAKGRIKTTVPTLDTVTRISTRSPSLTDSVQNDGDTDSDMDMLHVERTYDFEVGAGWFPIYIAECSFLDNNLFLDDRYVVVNDGHVLVTKPVLQRKSVQIETMIPLTRVINFEIKNQNIGFDWAFPHLVIQYSELNRVLATNTPKRRKSKIRSRSLSIGHKISTLILRTSMKSWRLPIALERAIINSNLRDAIDITVYYDISFIALFKRLETSLLQLGPSKELDSDGKYQKNVNRKIRRLQSIERLALWNRAVKAEFWRSMKIYKFIFDDIELAFVLVKRYTEKMLRPSKRRYTNAQIASIIGLKNPPPLTKPILISEEKCLAAIKYLRQCVTFMTVMLFDAEQVEERLKIFRMISPYGLPDFVKICLMRVPPETQPTQPQDEELFATRGISHLFPDETDKHSNASSEISTPRSSTTSQESIFDPTPELIAPVSSSWSSVPVRVIPGKHGRFQSTKTLATVAAAFDSFKSPHGMRTSMLYRSNYLLRHAMRREERSRSQINDSGSEYSRDSSDTESKDFDSRGDTESRSRSSSRYTGSDSQSRRGDSTSNTYSNSSETTSSEDAGGKESQIWCARWPPTKTASFLQKKAHGRMIQRLVNRNTPKPSARDIRDRELDNERLLLKQPKYKIPDILDKDAILALPVPDFIPEPKPLDDVLLSMGQIYHEESDDQDENKLTDASRFLSFVSIGPEIYESETSSQGLFKGAFPSDFIFYLTDVNPSPPTPKLDFVHEEFRSAAIETSALLWELCSISRLDSEASLTFDKLIVSWIENDMVSKARPDLLMQQLGRGGGANVIIEYLLACFHQPFRYSNEYGDTEKDQYQMTVGFSTEVLCLMYRGVLMLKHLIKVLGIDVLRGIWREEFRFILREEFVRRAFAGDSRPISQATEALFVDICREFEEGIKKEERRRPTGQLIMWG